MLDRLTFSARPMRGSARAPRRPARRLQRKHALMLALAIEVLFAGFANAGRYRTPGVVIEQTLHPAHVIT